MALILRIEGNNVGTITFVTQKKDCFIEEHARLFQLLLEPFALVVVNNKKDLQIVRLRETLKDENHFLNQYRDKVIGSDDGLKAVKVMLNHTGHIQNVLTNGAAKLLGINYGRKYQY